MNNTYYQSLIDTAKAILEENWVGTHTKPSFFLYPHQWNWDSGFISVGYSSYMQKRAQQEIYTLFAGQWKNGMVPQIVFDPDSLGGYFPEPGFWQTEKSGLVKEGKLTSGITMPPVHATVCRKIFERAKDKKESEIFLENMYPKLKRFHEYLYRYRDPKQEGLVYIRHPWESGVDNSPTWDKPLKSIKVDKSKLPPYERKDLSKGVPKEQRPTDEEYDRYVFLVDLFRRLNYDDIAIDAESPFKVQDILFNSILNRANKDLIFIADIIGEDSSDISKLASKTTASMQKKLWNRKQGIFNDYDLYNDNEIGVETASGFLPLYSGDATVKQAKKLYKYLESASFCAMHQGNCFSVPNFNMMHEEFDQVNYWRGPIWINMNWMLYHGLKSYGFREKAMSVMEDILELVRLYGFREYYDPYKGMGYGTNSFSWTAALFIDTVYEMDYPEEVIM